MADKELSLPPHPPKSNDSNPILSFKLSNDSSLHLKLLNQVEHYFSDFNLATSDHLLRLIDKDPEGFVAISVLASFKNIKSLMNGLNHRQLATILRNSSKLVLSEDGKKVRRLHRITESEMEELQSRIIVAENLPEDRCRQSLMKVFSAVGSVKAIRTCQPQATNGRASSVSRSSKFDNLRYSTKLHAFVEYESVELAERAVMELNNKGNRSSLRVRLMVKRRVGNRNKRSNNNGKKKKKKTTSNDDGVGCLNYITPLNKNKIDEELDSNSISDKESTKTPPIQASVSPEMQHLQVSLSTSSSITPGYTYAAGHILSGITDKRKCRPKGLLTVGASKKDLLISNSQSNSSMDASLPFSSPSHASMHWLRLSPSDTYHLNDDSSLEISSKSLSSSPPLLFPGSSCVSPFSLSSLGTYVNNTSTPSGSSSGNVICTPTSDSTSHTHNYVETSSRLSRAATIENTFTSQLDSIAQCLHETTLSSSPNYATTLDVQSFRDSVSIGSSFQFDTLTASYSSADLTHFRQLTYDHNSSKSSCSSQSGTMISSREMLMSEICEMDEFDICRCLSDEDDNSDGTVANIFYDEPRVECKGQQGRESYPHCSCAESISADEGLLLASSTDSDYDLVPQK